MAYLRRHPTDGVNLKETNVLMSRLNTCWVTHRCMVEGGGSSRDKGVSARPFLCHSSHTHVVAVVVWVDQMLSMFVYQGGQGLHGCVVWGWQMMKRREMN